MLVAASVAGPARAGSSVGAAPGTWHCGYVVTPGELWAIRCYDVALLAAYDAAIEASPTLVWDVPLWGPPMSEDRAVELVRAVLCERDAPCEVDIIDEARLQTAQLR